MKKVNKAKLEKLAQKHELNTKQKALVEVHLANPSQSGYKCAREAGYTHNTARTNPLSHHKIKSTLIDYLKGTSVESKLQRHYDEALDLSVQDGDTLQDKLSIISTKNAIVKEIHKISGHYAPEKRVTAKFSVVRIPDMDEEG